MKTFDHNINTGVCTYIDLVSINNDTDALALVMGFITGYLDGTVVNIGQAKLNPKDKHYVKSIGREVAVSKAQQIYFKVTQAVKSFHDSQTRVYLLGHTSDHKRIALLLKVTKGKRVQIEVSY